MVIWLTTGLFYKSNLENQSAFIISSNGPHICTEICGPFGEILKADGFSKLDTLIKNELNSRLKISLIFFTSIQKMYNPSNLR